MLMYPHWIMAILVRLAMTISCGSFIGRDCSLIEKAASIRSASCNGGLQE